ncbi:MAG: CRISPR-associated protein Cas4 [Clostridiales bacterium]|nr:CRISPR-associated protein Cas4 [Clostridiales bacterium]
MDRNEMLMLSGLQHFAFCPRQWALIHIEQQWQENLLTVQGMLMHERAHSETTEKRGNTIISRGLHIQSQTLGITGICDVVEFHVDSLGIAINGYSGTYKVLPVEYKKGRPKEHNADELQLCAQAMCLEEMLMCDIPIGNLYYGENRRRTQVNFSKALRDEVRELVNEMHRLYKRKHTPMVKYASRCKSCSLVDICLPKLFKGRHKSALAYVNQILFQEGDAL